MSSDNTRWFDDAACKGQWALFDSTKAEDKVTAKSICAGCPVRFECLQDALDTHERSGIRGGVGKLELRIVQSVNSKGETHIYPGRRIRCPYCGPRSTKHLKVIERRRSRTDIECTSCGLKFQTRKLINKKETNF